MEMNSTAAASPEALFADEGWFDPIEAGLRERIRGFIEVMLEEELTAALGRGRCQRGPSKGTAMAGGSGSCSARSGLSGSACRRPACRQWAT